MKPKFYKILVDSIETGIDMGYHRAFKYNDNPTPDTIKESIYIEVMNAIHENFDLTEELKNEG